MIIRDIQAKKSSSSKGAVSYVLSHDSDHEVIELAKLNRIDEGSINSMSKQFDALTTAKPSMKSPMFHFSFRPHSAEGLSKQDVIDMTLDGMQRFFESAASPEQKKHLSLNDFSYMIVAHKNSNDDSYHTHVLMHRLALKADPETGIQTAYELRNSYSRLKMLTIARELAKDYGLQHAPGLKNENDKPDVKAPRSKGEHIRNKAKEKRGLPTGQDFKEFVLDKSNEVLNKHTEPTELIDYIDAMKKQGIDVHCSFTKRNDQPVVQGLVFSNKKESFKGSEISRSLSFNQLMKSNQLIVSPHTIDKLLQHDLKNKPAKPTKAAIELAKTGVKPASKGYKGKRVAKGKGRSNTPIKVKTPIIKPKRPKQVGKPMPIVNDNDLATKNAPANAKKLSAHAVRYLNFSVGEKSHQMNKGVGNVYEYATKYAFNHDKMSLKAIDKAADTFDKQDQKKGFKDAANKIAKSLKCGPPMPPGYHLTPEPMLMPAVKPRAVPPILPSTKDMPLKSDTPWPSHDDWLAMSPAERSAFLALKKWEQENSQQATPTSQADATYGSTAPTQRQSFGMGGSKPKRPDDDEDEEDNKDNKKGAGTKQGLKYNMPKPSWAEPWKNSNKSKSDDDKSKK